jgi:sulfatase modifying factor 1
MGAGAVLASAMIGASAAGIVKKEEPKAGVGSCGAYSGLPSEDSETAGMIFVPGGTFTMGSERHQPEERFTHVVRVDGFWIDRHEVTNAQFEKFIDATGYARRAKTVDGGNTSPVRTGGSPVVQGVRSRARKNHPVVHIAYEDALAYAQWLGRSLPTEAQWEFAARGGRDGEDGWGSAYDPEGKSIANSWQGTIAVVEDDPSMLQGLKRLRARIPGPDLCIGGIVSQQYRQLRSGVPSFGHSSWRNLGYRSKAAIDCIRQQSARNFHDGDRH